MAITLYKFFPAWNVPDPSAPCVKVESFLRLHNIEYTAPEFDLSLFKQSPTGRLPYIETEDGQKISDSGLIINHLIATMNIDPNEGLTDKERAISYAFCSMLDETVYYLMVYSRWVDPIGWNVTKEMFFNSIPRLMRNFIANSEQKKMQNRLNKQGYGLNSQKENYTLAKDAFKALSDLLGDDKWFFGNDKPTLLDIVCHAYVINVVRPPIETELKTVVNSFRNLTAHSENIQKLIYTLI